MVFPSQGGLSSFVSGGSNEAQIRLKKRIQKWGWILHQENIHLLFTCLLFVLHSF